uniref:Putative secreted protein n=1 Tax=Anopheles marajoara TaxID=58244 RepID=A0A2M4CC73_9DIPT
MPRCMLCSTSLSLPLSHTLLQMASLSLSLSPSLSPCLSLSLPLSVSLSVKWVLVTEYYRTVNSLRGDGCMFHPLEGLL